MIQVCFALYDGTGTYSRFTGTAMLSLFENHTPPLLPSITVHLLHDNTLKDDDRDKLIQIADRYGQQLKFYNVEELCADRFAQIEKLFPDVYADRHSIAMFYRFFIPDLLLPQGIEKAIYLDSDIVVNLDIAELWQIELGDKPFGAIPEVNQFNNKDVGIKNKKGYVAIIIKGLVNPEDYLNSGVLLMNLNVLREEEANILEGIKFISEHPQFEFLDQDILNYCFSTSYLKLPTKFNRFVLYARRENEWAIEKNIYHFAASRLSFIMDSRDPFNQMFMNYFIKTPWIDDDTKVALAGGIPFRKNYPISVVIPLYNMQEYIGECLDSLLIQTFQAFEVIVVDDCSTDNSVAIVKSYASKFGGRLELTKTKTNSGGGGYLPRNIGMMLARGEYVYFLDADDMILSTALETFYLAAILYDAEVVYTSAHYNLKAPNEVYVRKNDINANINTELIINDLNKNLSRLLPENKGGEFHTPWTRFCRRNFLLENRIFFPNISHGGDFVWVVGVYCHARRFLRISTPLYFYRRYNNSITRQVRAPQEQCLYWFSNFENFIRSFLELERKNEVLAENPIYGLIALRQRLMWYLNRTEEARKEIDSEELYKILHEEFVKKESDSSASLLSFFFSFIDSEKKNNEYYSKIIDRFNCYFTARIDIKCLSTKGDFQIVSASDERTIVRKPAWLQKNSIGYVVQSYAGELEIVAKSTMDGKIELALKGLDVRSPEGKTKRIPYWIDYTKLTINEKTIFDTLTPTWHDESYKYKMDVKANEEIKIRVEWQPHRADTIEVKAVTPPPPKVTAPEPKVITPPKSKVIAPPEPKVVAPLEPKVVAPLEPKVVAPPEPKVVAPPEPKVVAPPEPKVVAPPEPKVVAPPEPKVVAPLEPKVVAPPKVENSISNRFKNDLTARIDTKLWSTEGDFQIVSAFDEKTIVRKPAWFQKNGIGYVMQSYTGELNFTAKTTVDGEIELALKGLDVRSPEDKTKRIPYWIDYTKLTINEKTIFDTLTPTWHDEPYKYKMDVKANEEIKIRVEWQPHRSNT